MLTEKRAALIPGASGRVLELGIGGGLNLKFYNPAQVSAVTGIDPSPELRAYARKAPRPEGLAVEILDASADAMPFADASFDTVVTTFTLCTVPDAPRALAEARRVLRPGGQLLFCEHGRSPDAGVALWQRRVEPLWKRVFGGCHLTRPVAGNIAAQFSIERLESGYMPKTPRLAGWVEWGRAVAV
ncbi:S-adenosylmethionine-dependent methyltransferase [Acidocella aquatica]|uniref:S-adenosylmethionine-dependent methyltransferase n=1 Tax=Acidocella aquatica TaxID=1922313 RepID=A0ABQ6ACF9_9PROT|nr:class I SAM-dependent methyltransferase [Acidocella aquatica]GLR67908.1 S-adenosylmethionine-dependent methyltransferase [Acidocella aquatica]